MAVELLEVKSEEDKEADRVSATSSRSKTDSTTSLRYTDQCVVSTIRRVRSDYSIGKQRRKKSGTLFMREHTFLRRDPMMLTCPNCLCAVETVIERRSTLKTHLSALLLVPVCLCVLPYCSKHLRNTLHRCPSCGILLGSNFASASDAWAHCRGQREQDCDEQYVYV